MWCEKGKESGCASGACCESGSEVDESLRAKPGSMNAIAEMDSHECIKGEDWEKHLADTVIKYADKPFQREYPGDKVAGIEEVETKDGKYRGEWVDGLKHGYGHLRMASATYEGQWCEDKKDGKGVLQYDDGRSYKGQFLADEFHGYAVMRFPGNIRYVGQYEHGLKHGEGAVYWDNEFPKCWAGQFSFGKRHGDGVYTDPSGNITIMKMENDEDAAEIEKRKAEKEKLEQEKAERKKSRQKFAGPWLCSNTFVEMCRIEADDDTPGKLTWTNKDVTSQFYTEEDFNTSVQLRTNDDVTVLIKMNEYDENGEKKGDKYIQGALQDGDQRLVWASTGCTVRSGLNVYIQGTTTNHYLKVSGFAGEGFLSSTKEADAEFKIYEWSGESRPIFSGDSVYIQDVTTNHYVEVLAKDAGLSTRAKKESKAEFKIFKWGEGEKGQISSGESVYIQAWTNDHFVEVSGNAVSTREEKEADAELKIESNEVWKRGPTEQTPQKWRVVDKGGAVVTADFAVNAKEKQIAKLKQNTEITVAEIRGHRARIVQPKEGCISIRTTEKKKGVDVTTQIAAPT